MKPVCFVTRELSEGVATRWARPVPLAALGALLLCWPWLGGCQAERSDPPQATQAARPAASPAALPGAASPPAARTSAPPRVVEAPVVVSQPARSPELSDEDLSADVSAPQVLLSADHQATCRVQVGDTFPDLSLMTREGQPTLLNAHLGQRLTIVIFWNHRQPMSVEQIERLQQDFAERYRNAGVAVVTVNVGESPEQLGQAAEPAPAGMVSLCDPRGEAFGQVATGLLPRTYLLRADRQVVWFDLEYSRSTRRELRNAILYVLRQFDQQAHAGGASLM